MARGQAIIMPMLGNDTRVHSTIGLSAVELQGIDNEQVVLVVEEKLPKSDRSKNLWIDPRPCQAQNEHVLNPHREGIAVFPRGPSAVDSEAHSRAVGLD